MHLPSWLLLTKNLMNTCDLPGRPAAVETASMALLLVASIRLLGLLAVGSRVNPMPTLGPITCIRGMMQAFRGKTVVPLPVKLRAVRRQAMFGPLRAHRQNLILPLVMGFYRLVNAVALLSSPEHLSTGISALVREVNGVRAAYGLVRSFLTGATLVRWTRPTVVTNLD